MASELIRTDLGSSVKTLELRSDRVLVLDQTLLPNELRYVEIRTVAKMAEAIETMIVRGAPAIGIAGAYGLVLGLRETLKSDPTRLREQLKDDAVRLNATRPTAVNLAWALERMLRVAAQTAESELLHVLTREAEAIHREDVDACRAMGDFGAALVPPGAGIMTHCNAGALATGGYGTALGVIRSAFSQDSGIHVYADETRPRLQGARLTSWELVQDGIPVTVVCDNMSGSLMRAGKVQMVVVGADRITANGDTANKIGTYNLALIAKAHNVPFYVAAPMSTIDMSLETGDAIPIEERHPGEIYRVGDEQLCADGAGYFNPAFDVTPAYLITAIITEKGVVRPEYRQNLPHLFL